jgi:hypothetical protein
LEVSRANKGTRRINSRLDSIDIVQIPPAWAAAIGSYNPADREVVSRGRARMLDTSRIARKCTPACGVSHTGFAP